MVVTVAMAGPLLLLQSIAAFSAEPASSVVLVLAAFLLTALPCVLVPVALLHGGIRARILLMASILDCVGLVVIERSETQSSPSTAFTPWLVGLACIVIAYCVVGTRRPWRAGVGGAVTILAFVAFTADRGDGTRVELEVLGLVALTAGLTVGARLVRARADAADDAQRSAQRRFDISQRHLAVEQQRIRTDALLHDSVLNALLIAAAGSDSPARTLAVARNALSALSSSGSGGWGSVTTFERAVASIGDELAPTTGLVRLDLHRAHEVELPTAVADALVSAMLQAITNSIKHAGPSADRTVHADPLDGSGIRVRVEDDGVGFDPDLVADERLGVRRSILDRMRLVGGAAEIRSAPGRGTTVLLEWSPTSTGSAADRRAMVTA